MHSMAKIEDICVCACVHRKKERERERERKKDILMSFKRPKWPIRPNKRSHRKCCLIFEKTTNQNKRNASK